MKNLDLAAYGVEEMDEQALIEIDGGLIPKSWWPAIIDSSLKFVKSYIDHAKKNPGMSETLMNCM